MTFYYLVRDRWFWFTFERDYIHRPFQHYIPCATHV